MTTVAIIQARVNSTRLPGKVLKLIGDSPVLWHVFNRVKAASKLDRVLVATSHETYDDPIDDLCKSYKIECIRGDENDVLSRFILCAKLLNANTIVRITADCPLISPTVIDYVIDEYFRTGSNYASNTLVRTFPHGLDVECFSFDTLYSAHINTKSLYDREHVTPFIYNRPNIYKLFSCAQNIDYSNLRITLDTQSDFDLMRALYFINESCFVPSTSWLIIPDLIASNPLLKKLHNEAKIKAQSK